MIVIVGTIAINPEKMDVFESLCPAHVARTLAQDSCLLFSVGVADRAKGQITVAEIWANEAALVRHHQQAFTHDFITTIGGLMENDTKIYEVSSVRPLPQLGAIGN